MTSDSALFPCEKCGNTTNHDRLNDPYAGELWRCQPCGWKSMRDEAKSWSKVTPEQRENPYEAMFARDMPDSRFRDVVHFMGMMMVGVDSSGRFTAAQQTRMAAIMTRSFLQSDGAIADELKLAGFDLSGMMSSPAQQVASFKRPCESKYKQVFGTRPAIAPATVQTPSTTSKKKWWQLWRSSETS